MPYPEQYTLGAVLQNSRHYFPDHKALADLTGTSYTYEELYQNVTKLGHSLQHQGIYRGDLVAILSENKPNWVVAYFAITSIGAVAVPILPDFQTNQVHHILRQSGCKAIFVSEKLIHKIEDGHFETLSTIIPIDDFSIPLHRLSNKLKNVLREGSKEFGKIKQAAKRLSPLHSEKINEQDIASVIYTSGTTGHSKGVMLTHQNIVFDAVATTKIQDVTPNDRLLSILPLAHSYECTVGMIIPIMQGATIYYINKPPTARILLPALQKVKPTMMLSVPLIIEKIYKTKIEPVLHGGKIMQLLQKIPPLEKCIYKMIGRKLIKSFGGSLRFFGIGGAAVSSEVERFMLKASFPYAIGYGLTETSPIIVGTNVEETKFRSVGKPLPGVDIRIHHPNPKTGEGEIRAKGKMVMKGYYRNPERTREVLDEKGWLKTGDLGTVDEEGYVFIIGRLKNMILGPSGENIYPEEIEALLNEHQYVSESLVYEQEKLLVARVHLNYESLDEKFTKQKLSESQIHKSIEKLLLELRQSVNELLPLFSRIHKIIEQTEPFEKTPTQKIKRYLYAD